MLFRQSTKIGDLTRDLRVEANGKTQQVIVCPGSPQERGNRYGRVAKDLIRRLLDSHKSLYMEYFESPWSSVLRDANKYIPFIDDYSSETAQEIRGIAEGAEVSLDELMTLIAYPEMYYPRIFEQCTAFAVGGSATLNEEIFVGQNEDDAPNPWLNGACSLLLSIPRKTGPDILTYTYAGVPSQKGINSAGLAMCVNGLTCEQSKIGVPTLIVTREVLYQKNVDEAVEAIRRAPLANSINILLADSDGTLCDIEATPNGCDFTYSNSSLVHTNHFLSRKLTIERDFIKDSLPDSCRRLERMNQLLTKAQKIELNTLKLALRDHEDFPNSICRHPNPKDPEPKQMKTFDSIIWVPRERTAWLAKGPPCQNKYYQYNVSGKIIGESL